MNVPRIDESQAQHYLSTEVIVGALLIVYDGLSQGDFPGPMAYFPFLMTFAILSLLAMIPTLSTAVAIIGGIVVVMLFLSPTPVKGDSGGTLLSGQLLFKSLGKASNNVAENGAAKAQGYGG